MGTILRFMETDATAPCDWVDNPFPYVACTGAKRAGGTGHALEAIVGGTPGTASKQISYRAGESLVGLVWQGTPGPNVTWQAAGWAVRMNVTGAPLGPGWLWRSVWICRVNAACTSVATVGSSLNFNMAITGVPQVYRKLVSGAAQPGAAADDHFYICLQLTNGTGGNDSINITSNQVITTPLLLATGATQLVEGGIVPPQLVDGVLVG